MTELTYPAKVKEYYTSVGCSQGDFARQLGIEHNGLYYWLNASKLNILKVKRVIKELVKLEAVTTLQQVHELLELAFPDQPVMHRFSTSEQKEDWYKSLLADATHQAGFYPQSQQSQQKKADAQVTAAYTLPARPTATPFIGREKDLKVFNSLLKNKDTRLITLAGPGGIGKTRLVLELAHETKERETYRDGVVFLSLVSISSGEELAILLCQTFGLLNSAGPWPGSGATAPEAASNDTTMLEEFSELLTNRLRTKHMLLVLDNFEQLVDAASTELVETLIANTYNLQIAVTSRRVLKLEAEQVFRVTTLPLPPKELMAQEVKPNPEELLKYGAIELFIAKAKRARHDFIFNADNAGQIVELCYRLDGLPLALELAGAYVAKRNIQKLLSLKENPLYHIASVILEKLPERHQNLIYLINWSYKLLSRDGKRLFSRLSVFKDGFDAEAVAEICFEATTPNTSILNHSNKITEIEDEEAREARFARTAEGFNIKRERVMAIAKPKQNLAKNPRLPRVQLNVWLDLDELVDQSLVQVEVARDGTGSNRYYLLETMRDYATLQLEGAVPVGDNLEHDAGDVSDYEDNCWEGSPEESAKLQERHAQYYLKLAKKAQPHINEQASSEWLNQLRIERGNMLSALRYYIEQHRTTKAYELAAALGPYWFRTKLYTEGVSWTDNILGMLSSNEHLPTIRLQASFLHQAGRLNNSLGNRAKAARLFGEAEKYWRELGDKKGLCLTLSGLGAVEYWKRDFEKASKYYEESILLAQAIKDDYTQVIALGNLNNIALATENYQQAKTIAHQCLLLERKLDNEPGMARRLKDLGLIARIEKSYSVAYNYYNESWAIYQQNPSLYQSELADLTIHYTRLDYLTADYKSCVQRTKHGLQISQDNSLHNFLPYWLLNLALIYIDYKNEPSEAIKLLGAIDTLANKHALKLEHEEQNLCNQINAKAVKEGISPEDNLFLKEAGAKMAAELSQLTENIWQILAGL